MRVALLATAEFALPTLDALLAAGHEVSLGTQPAREAGRGRRRTPTPVAARADALGLECTELEDVNAPEGLAWLTRSDPDLITVVAFGQKLGPSVRAAAPWGCVNVHPSLLPRWRGAAPVPAAILAGDEKTGVCIIEVVERMDAGDVLGRRATTTDRKTAGDLLDELSRTGAGLLIDVIDRLASGTLRRVAQDESAVTRARKLSPDDGRIRWEDDDVAVDRRVRAVTPRPGAFAILDGQDRLRVLAGEPPAEPRGPPPGEGVEASEDAVSVACGKGAYLIQRLQRAGGRPMDAAAFLRGRSLTRGARFGP